jgi:hypothetical protein
MGTVEKGINEAVLGAAEPLQSSGDGGREGGRMVAVRILVRNNGYGGLTVIESPDTTIRYQQMKSILNSLSRFFRICLTRVE